MRRILRIGLLLSIPLLGALVYWPGLSGGFLFDDHANLVLDPDWKAETLAPSELYRAMALGIASDFGRPIALLSFAVNHALTGLAPWPLKATGLAFHLLNGVLIALLCRQLFALAPAAVERERMGVYAATLVALAWTVHPLQVSSALYIVQRMEVGAHTGVLLALLCYLHARRRQMAGRSGWPWLLLAGGWTAFGLGFKESALLVPGYAFALELCVLRFRGREGRRSRAWIAAYSLGIAVAVAGYLFVLLPKFGAEAAYATRDFTLAERLLTQPRVLRTYLGQMLFPVPSSLLFYYDHFPISRNLLGTPSPLPAILLLLALAGAAALARRRWPLVSLGIAWFFVAHALTSNIVPLELAFEHRNYFALLGILIALAQVMAWASSRLHMDARRTLAALPVAFLAVLCAIQAQTWGDPFRLAIALASRNPESPRASYDLGQYMLALAGSDRASPLLDLAEREFEHAAALPGSSPLPEQALIVTRARRGLPISRDLWERFKRKLVRRAVGPQEISALYGVVQCRVAGQCALDDNQLLGAFVGVLRRNPGSASLHAMYANYALNVLHDYALAVDMSEEAIRLQPDEVQYKANLARILAAQDVTATELAELIEQIRREDTHGRYAREIERTFRPPPPAPTPPGPGEASRHAP